MSKPRNIESYPRQLMQLVLEFESTGGERLIRGLSSSTVAREVRAELYGLRDAIKRSGHEAEYPYFMSARMYVVDSSIVIVSADKLDYAIELDGTISEGG